jgi:4-amino-4-deoxy-L-arabinose transferase-like glycosyltransferase
MLFLLTRVWNVSSFPIFNDEGIYLQYSQLIHNDFSANKYVSVNNIYSDWKPPLQYWIGSLFITSKRDPLVTGRIVASVFSLIGLFGTYFFVRRLFNPMAAAAAAVFYVISPLTLFYNTQFVAETFVFSSTAVLYACLAAMLQSWKRPKTAIAWFAASVLAGALLVLFKQAGALPLYLSILLPIAFWTGWRALARDAAAVAAVIVLSSILSSASIPSQYSTNKAAFTAQWTMSVKEIAALPFAVWSSNAREIWNLYASYYTPAMLAVILLYAVWFFVWGTSKDRALLALFLSSSAAIIFCLKEEFNEYIYHTAIIVFMLAMLGRVAAISIDCFQTRGLHRRLLAALPGIVLAFIGVFWVYQCMLIKTDSAGYLRQASPWAKENYLTGWPSGYGVKSVAQFLSSRTGTGLVILDPQWGNPRTSLEVFRPFSYPNLQLFPMGSDLFEKESLLKKLNAAGIRENRFVIFSDWFPADSPRVSWGPYVKANYCANRKLFTEHPGQIPIIVCEF